MKYKYIPQKPYCCVPACVQMILHRRKLPVPLQTDIAYNLGIILPLKDRHLLPKSYKGHKPKAGWGTRISLKKYSLTTFFKQRRYSLQEAYYSVKRFSSEKQFREFLLDKLKTKNDLLICFNYPLLYHTKGSWGHASLIEEVKKKHVIFRDPSQKHKSERRVLISELFEALKNHHGGGVWVVSDQEKPS